MELSSAYTRVHNKEMPASHSRGSKPIMAFLATPGVDCEAYFIGRFKLGVGNHCGPHVLDIPIASLLGTDEICPRSLEGRKLQVKDVPRCRKKYNADLKQVTADHNMESRMKKIDKKVNKLPDRDEYLPLSAAVRSKKEKILAECNAWDAEFTQQQKGCENRCRKKFVGLLPFSPEIQGWIDRKDTLNCGSSSTTQTGCYLIVGKGGR